MNAEEQLTNHRLTRELRVAERAAEIEQRAQERINDAWEVLDVVAYDVKEPLRATMILAHVLARRYKERLDKQADEFLDRIADAANRMAGVITPLLEYARVGRQGAVVPVDCGTVLTAGRRLLETAFEESGAELTAKGIESLQVLAAETEMMLLFKHLIGNALKFRGDRPVQIHVEAEKQSDAWLLCVRDNGIGSAKPLVLYLSRASWPRLRRAIPPESGQVPLEPCSHLFTHSGR